MSRKLLALSLLILVLILTFSGARRAAGSDALLAAV